MLLLFCTIRLIVFNYLSIESGDLQLNIKKGHLELVLLVLCSAVVFLFLLNMDSRERVILLYDLDTRMETAFEEAITGRALNWDVQKIVFSDSLERELEHLGERGYSIIIGPRTSSQAQILVPLLEKFEMVAIAPAVTSPEVLKSTDRIISLGVSDDYQVQEIVRKLFEEDINRLIVIKDVVNRVYTDYFVEMMKEKFSGTVLAVYEISSGFDLSIPETILDEADAIFFVTNPRQTAVSLRHLARLDKDLSFFASDYSEGPELALFGCSDIVELTIFTFLQEIPAGYNSIDSVHAGIHNAVVFADILLTSGKGLQEVFATPERVEFPGLGGRISFNDLGFAELAVRTISPQAGE